ncbi:outer membrane beta-barrel protein [Chitinophaga rhizosphaerae]|uniref:outer membrane beta-barrel protein n=1 Tax=Chitinophaga rhizosphaerae TaxID=1864947 RepID=UPI000F8072AD|nr:outer membrane beta-barrel protein [Chitinophaga rhizosphaerae]
MQMKFARSLLLFLLTLAGSVTAARAQQKDVPQTGLLKGKVIDSVYNYMLTSATVAIYHAPDSMLLKYSMPDNFGEFKLPSLPVGKPLKLVITHVGYVPFIKQLTLNTGTTELDLGTLYMHQGKGALKEIVVTAAAPVRMNGDTLEFNADAFRLDSNATAEDLIRKLPGFTVWGDGDITYNGKKIQQVLVEGKAFMGSTDPAIATQNLPKSALDKIQVYQQRDEKNPLDSTMFANIKLKDDSQSGIFGKAGGGPGTDGRYAADGMLSGFNRNIQASAVGALNNINKIAANTDVLIKNSAYQGEGPGENYQSDFNMKGLNRPIAAGMKFIYDFFPGTADVLDSRLNTNYFMNNVQNRHAEESLSKTFLDNATELSTRSLGTGRQRQMGQDFHAVYDRSTDKYKWEINTKGALVDNDAVTESRTEQEQTGTGPLSKSVSHREATVHKKRAEIGISYTNYEENGLSVQSRRKRAPRGFTAGYQFSCDEQDGQARALTEFTSMVATAESRTFDRRYDRQNGRNFSHTLNAGYSGLRRLIFNRAQLGGVNIGISVSLALNLAENDDRVLDKEAATGKYQVNPYLTNEREVRTSDFKPALHFSKLISRELTNRFSKWINISADLQEQFYVFGSQALQRSQDLSYRYTRFLPAGSIVYNNHQFGNYESKYSLAFTTLAGYPAINDLAPLADSADLWFIPKGNPLLQPQFRKMLSAGYHFATRKGRNPLLIDANASLTEITGVIGDSTVYDSAGIRSVYAVNLNGYRAAGGNIRLKKSIELRRQTLELGARYAVNTGRYPQYQQHVLNMSHSTSHQVTAHVSYRRGSRLALKAEQGWTIYNSEQQGFNHSRFRSVNSYSLIDGVLQLPDNLYWNTHLSINTSSVRGMDAIRYVRWNASLAYRFLKGKRGEVKCAALDLLRQNKGIVNTATGNSQTFVTSNVLQQYFMMTLSYYPRKFGKRGE